MFLVYLVLIFVLLVIIFLYAYEKAPQDSTEDAYEKTIDNLIKSNIHIIKNFDFLILHKEQFNNIEVEEIPITPTLGESGYFLDKDYLVKIKDVEIRLKLFIHHFGNSCNIYVKLGENLYTQVNGDTKREVLKKIFSREFFEKRKSIEKERDDIIDKERDENQRKILEKLKTL